MAILSALFMGMFGKVFSRWWAAFAAVLALAGYTLLAGAGALAVALICGVVIALAAVREHMKSPRLNSIWNQLKPVVMLLGVGGLSLFA